jgi:HSF-type DNA-binding
MPKASAPETVRREQRIKALVSTVSCWRTATSHKTRNQHPVTWLLVVACCSKQAATGERGARNKYLGQPTPREVTKTQRNGIHSTFVTCPDRTSRAEKPMSTNDGERVQDSLSGQASHSYHDHALSQSPAGDANFRDTNSKPDAVPRFPERLFHMLDRAEAEGKASTISWQPHGRCFVVWNVEEFTSMLTTWLPGMTRWKSFQRQLHLWGFKRLTKGPDLNGYFHESFLRYRPNLLPNIRRKRRKAGAGEQKTEAEPDFYTMPFITPLSTSPDDTSDEALTAYLETTPSDSEGEEATAEHPGSANRSSCSLNGKVDSDNREEITATQNSKTLNGSPLRLHDVSLSQSVIASIGATALTTPLTTDAGSLQHQIIENHIVHSIHQDRVVGPNPELEPRPLPPVMIQQGEVVCGTYTPVPVARHPSFVRIGPNEYYGSARTIINPVPEPHPLPSESRHTPGTRSKRASS